MRPAPLPSSVALVSLIEDRAGFCFIATFASPVGRSQARVSGRTPSEARAAAHVLAHRLAAAVAALPAVQGAFPLA